MRILLVGVFFVCLNTFTGASFDTITKYLSMNNYKWYHYYSIGGTAAIILFIFFFIANGEIKKHIMLKHNNHFYFLILRGISFIPVLLIVFFSLKHIPISLFATLIMTSPFFLMVFAKFILKEKLNYLSWIAIIIGFCGVIIVLRPSLSTLNIFIFLVILAVMIIALNFTLVSKYSYITSSYGFTFYQYVPITLFSYIFFLYDPFIPSLNELVLFCSSGILMMISMWAWNTAYHIAGKYSSIISPFFFTQIIWASIYGKFFFSEELDSITVIGVAIIIISGTVAIYNQNK
jgi:drug/metabolite transporter (DMT)-like permease